MSAPKMKPSVTCPNCGDTQRVYPNLVGKNTRCTNCKNEVFVETTNTDADAPKRTVEYEVDCTMLLGASYESGQIKQSFTMNTFRAGVEFTDVAGVNEVIWFECPYHQEKIGWCGEVRTEAQRRRRNILGTVGGFLVAAAAGGAAALFHFSPDEGHDRFFFWLCGVTSAIVSILVVGSVLKGFSDGMGTLFIPTNPYAVNEQHLHERTGVHDRHRLKVIEPEQ